MNQYQTRVDCEVAGQWRVAGLPFSLTSKQAAELMPPRGNVVALWVDPAAVSAAVTKEVEPQHGRLGRNKRRNRKAPN
jgi:hypothetical protein